VQAWLRLWPMRCLKQLSSTRVISQDASSSRTSTAVVTNLDLMSTPRHLDPGLHAGLPEDLANLQARPSPGRRASGMAGAESLRLGRGGQGVAPRRPPPTATTRQPRDIATPRTHRYRRGAIPGPPCDRSHCRRDATNPQRASSVMPCPIGESGQENSTDNAEHLPAQRYAQLFAFGR
jgi:hypothetical protein